MNIIIAPIITEKSMTDAAVGKFTFRVDKSANKNQIRREVEEKFSVNVIGVSTSILKGRMQRVGAKREEVKIGDVKKAIVRLKAGQKIGLFDLGGDNKKHEH